MVALIVLIAISSIIFLLQKKTWSINKNIVFPIVTSVFYFWSLAGAWLFIFDKMTGIGESIGLGYYYLLEKMFYVELDGTYAFVIGLYGLFIVAYQLTCLFFLKKNSKENHENKSEFKPINLHSLPIVLVAIVSLLGSFILVKDVIFYSLILNESVYINVRSSGVSYYSIHQYFNWIMIVSLYIYLGLYYSKGIKLGDIKKPSILFWIVFFICNLYLVFIGSRHETFLAGIIAVLLFSFPQRSIRKSLKLYLTFGVFFATILALNDPIRAMLPSICSKTGLTSVVSTQSNKRKAELFQLDRTFIVHKSEKKSRDFIKKESLKDTTVSVYQDSIKLEMIDVRLKKQEFFAQIKDHPNYLLLKGNQLKLPNPKISGAYNKISLAEKVIHSITNIIFSNELFAGHFSLYGIFKYDVNPKFGLSFRAMLEFVKPKTDRSSEVLDAYSYYAKKMKFPPGQGFTINHISSWYLNFSYFGIVIGGMFIAFILMFFYVKKQRASGGIGELLSLIVLCSVTAFCAMLVRSGPEAFKSLLIEAIIIPVVIYFSAIVFTKYMLLFRDRFKSK